MSHPAAPCVLLVEDDSSITRFVEMALDQLPIELLTCTTVPAAVTLLQQRDVKLVITDLMLPGESGISLVKRMAADPLLGRDTRVAVFSAGLTPAVKDQLEDLNLWRVLSKPIAVQELENCVLDALATQAAADALASESAPATFPPAPAPIDAEGSSAPCTPAEKLAITTHFGGDAQLFTTYRAACLKQFAADVHTGDAAAQAQDWPALRRLAHSLATVLLTLGRPEDSLTARALEDAAAANAAPACLTGWGQLRTRLGASA
ncbi:two-component system response regulator [Acidovorax sp. 106]|jgi:CheY-like chemotaxis protein|uniref:response regulator n=1 Tax=Acidovorax sp. 106 TaxID=2135637 RepID=UPI000EAB654C|nr:response regulator [Acidovorax sp. 106]RLJ39513.1 response regulator receiver domain-containing protein [Acidovorax sp. 106]